MKLAFFAVAGAAVTLAACGNGGGQSDVASACAKLELDPQAAPYVTKAGNDFATFCDCMETVLEEASEAEREKAVRALTAVTDGMSEDQPRVETIADQIEAAAEANDATDEAKALAEGVDIVDNVIGETVDRLEANGGKCSAAG
jgi:ElaB/YqjD/DUF883 family membrane-anchored ribosome-binding protein